MRKAKVRYIVDDVEAAIEFYCKKLGFKIDMHPAPGFAALSKGALQLYLNAPGAGGAGASMRDGTEPEPGGWNRIQIEVEDLEKTVADLRRSGVSFRNDIVDGKGGKEILLEDPASNLIELFEPHESGVKPIPEGFSTITPFLVAEDIDALIHFVEKAFAGTVEYRMRSDDGQTRHATVRIGDSLVMISSAEKIYGSPRSMLHLYVENVDALYRAALDAGGKSIREPSDQFHGDRSAGIEDKWENQWWLATHIEDVGEEELKQREAEFRQLELQD